MAGISLRLGAAQVIKLVGPGNRSAGSFGFGEEDGYESEESPAEQAGFGAEGSAPASGNGDSDDF